MATSPILPLFDHRTNTVASSHQWDFLRSCYCHLLMMLAAKLVSCFNRNLGKRFELKMKIKRKDVELNEMLYNHDGAYHERREMQ